MRRVVNPPSLTCGHVGSSCTRCPAGHGRLRSVPGSADRRLRSEQERLPCRALHMIMDQNRHGKDGGGTQGAQEEAGTEGTGNGHSEDLGLIPNTIELVAGFKEKIGILAKYLPVNVIVGGGGSGWGQGAQSLAGTLGMWRS